uniref:Odorant Binding Protein n=1 Tax=Epiphyas postvittana TaxID=65032 RepID=A0A0K8TUU6_EPIPO
MVYYILAIFIVAAPQVFADEEADIMSCLEMFKPDHIEEKCCEDMNMFDEDFESCKTKEGEWECENAKCVLEKAGILNGDTIDEKKAAAALEKHKKEYPANKAMFDRVQAQCMDGKYEEYPPKEACPLIKLQICSYIQSVVECQSWKQSDTCKKMSDHAKTCKTVLDNSGAK